MLSSVIHRSTDRKNKLVIRNLTVFSVIESVEYEFDLCGCPVECVFRDALCELLYVQTLAVVVIENSEFSRNTAESSRTMRLSVIFMIIYMVISNMVME